MKVIGITCSRIEGSHSGVNREYSDALIRAGAAPFLLPVTAEGEVVRQQVAMLDGILLSGGLDVAPLLYGQQPQRGLGKVDGLRDANERLVLDAAVAQNKPVLGICRGIQMLNVYFGGTLFQDLDSKADILGHDQTCERHLGSHTIAIAPGSWLGGILGEKAVVNSFHHQAVERVAPGFTVTARTEDGVIEAMEDAKRRCYGVQFHPEMMAGTNEKAQEIFCAFVKIL